MQARLAQMEEEIQRSHEQLTWSNEQLAEVCMLVVTLAANRDTQLRAEESEVLAWRHNVEAGFKDPKMAKPKPFSGKIDETELFINTCWMFICRHLKNFPSERMAIRWAVLYMNQGLACEWHDDYLEDAKEGNY